jgi:hypothetical protein
MKFGNENNKYCSQQLRLRCVRRRRTDNEAAACPPQEDCTEPRFRGAVQVTMGIQCVAYAGLVPVPIRLSWSSVPDPGGSGNKKSYH